MTAMAVKFNFSGSIGVLLLFVLLSAVVWGRAAGHDFVWDDEYFVVSNQAIRSWSFIPAYFTDLSTMAGRGYARSFPLFRPLRNISYLIDFKIAGLAPAWWHLHNLVIHLFNAIIVFLIARELLKGKLPSLFAGALYLVHPVQSEVVAWVKCRDDLLCGLFVFIAFFLWLRWRTSELRRGNIAVLVVLYLLACLSKAQAIIFPLILLGYEYWIRASANKQLRENNAMPAPLEGSLSLSGVRSAVGGLSAAGAGYLLWRHFFIGQTAQSEYLAGGILPTMLTMTKVGVKYLGLLVYPNRLIADYSGMQMLRSWADWQVWVFGGILLAIAACVFIGRRRWPVESFGLVWVAVCLLPVSNVIPMMQYMAERFLYLPMAGFAIAAASLLWRFQQRNVRLALAVAVIVIAACSVKSAARVKVWQDGGTLFTRTVRDTPPGAIRPRRNLLSHLVNSGEYEKALLLSRQLLEKSKEEKNASSRDKAEYIRHQGFIFLQTGKAEAGAELLLSAIEIDPSYITPYIDLGVAEGKKGNHSGALGWFDDAIKKCPTDAPGHYNRAVALREVGQEKEAENAFRKAIFYGYEEADAHKSLAALLWGQGKIGETIPIYREAARIWRGDHEIGHYLNEAIRQSSVGGSGRIDSEQ